jgi:ferric-dicitrate binding protein FerR (iron transport regulator)
MSRNTMHDRMPNALTSTWHRARQAAAWLQRASEQAKPSARTAGAAARHHANKARAWAAPQVERAGQVLQDSIAPKTSSLLSAAASRIDPARPGRRRARKMAGASAIVAAAAATAATLRSRLKARAAAAAGPAAADGTASGDDGTVQEPETRDERRSPDSDVLHDSSARTT